MKERREFPRVDVNVNVNVNKQVRAKVKNISKGGICITTREPLNKGRLLTLSLTLPDGSQIIIKGKVMWSLQIISDFFENGIDFMEANKLQYETINRLTN
ncbi:MAG: PilZ domain-containing protein [Spirochaetales bacterium]|nr:PilZ domain-containing protein [Spirochaetales bacterium]